MICFHKWEFLFEGIWPRREWEEDLTTKLYQCARCKKYKTIAKDINNKKHEMNADYIVEKIKDTGRWDEIMEAAKKQEA